MKQKFSTLFFLLLFLFSGLQVVAQKAPGPFDIEQPSLRVNTCFVYSYNRLLTRCFIVYFYRHRN